VKKFKVAAAQIKIANSAPEKNVKKIIKYLKKAAKKGVDIVLFPETCVYYYSKDDPKDLDKYLEQIKSACADNNIWCIFTSYHLRGNKKYNTAFLIDRKGKVVYEYDKMNPYVVELPNICAGKSNKVIDTEFGKIGIIICFDICFPEPSRELAKAGALLIFCPTCSIGWTGYEYVARAIPLVRAYENMCSFVLCDCYAKDTISESVIISPREKFKHIRKREGLIIQTVDLREVEKLRNSRYKL